MIGVTLRPATTGDGEFAFRVWKAAMKAYVDATWGWDESEQRRRQREEFSSSPPQIMEAGGQAVGTLVVKHDPGHIYLSGLYLLPEHQRRGYGSRILKGLIAQGQACHLPIRLHVLKVNPQAQQLYERMGFVVTHQEDCFIVMEW